MRFCGLFLALTMTVCLLPRQTFADAKDLAEQIVVRSGLSFGYDETAKTIVFIGTSQKPVADISDARIVMKLREEESKIGMLKAKAEILKCLVREVSSTSIAAMSVTDGTVISETSSAVEILSHLVLHGFQTICTAESFENGLFQTAVAIGWSEKSEQVARAALLGKNINAMPELNESRSPEWEKWAREQDFSAMVVSRSFEDSRGIRRYVGIGFSDVDGKTGASLVSAMTLAWTKAKQNLIYALHSDVEARNLATQFVKTKVTADGSTETETTRSAVRRIAQKCKSVVLPACGEPVFETMTHHPITGRKIYVCLAGIEPSYLAAMKIWEP